MKITYGNIKPALTRVFSVRLFICFLIVVISSCEDFINVESPRSELSRADVFTSDENAISAFNGLYSKMMSSHIAFASGGIGQYCGLSADEFINYSSDPSQVAFYQNGLTAQNTKVSILWQEGYRFIYATNAILEGISKSTSLTTSTRNQLEGEAKFLRAFCYFYLVNLFGDLPLSLSTEYTENTSLGRSSQNEVYQQIINDLLEAQNLMVGDYSHVAGSQRARPNKWAATTMLARVYLFREDYVNAEALATSVISNPAYSILTDLTKVFLKNSSESILQFSPVIPNYNTFDGYYFIFTSTPNNVALSTSLYSSFESGDLRKANWVGQYTGTSQTYYYPFKYKVRTSATVTEHMTVLRLAELYLIRSEARARQSKLSESISDLDIIRNRAGLPLLQNTNPGISQPDLLLAIEKERRIELMTEWGHRWLDLKRNKGIADPSDTRADEILSTLKGNNWQKEDKLYPIPLNDIKNNLEMVQNPGY